MTDFIAKEGFSGSAGQTLKFGGVRNAIVVGNDGSANLTFTINANTYTVGPGAVWDEELDPFESVTFVATGAYYGHVRRNKSETR